MNTFDDRPSELTFQQRWATFLTALVAITALIAGYLMRGQTVNATVRFENKEAGIAVRYPAGWLTDQAQTDFVFRAQDLAALPYKTTLQVSLLTVGPDARAADIPDLLNIPRATEFSAYRALQIVSVRLPNGMPGLQMEYAYVDSETNPSLQSVPIVVRAIDVIVLRRNQAVIITYRADSQTFEKSMPYFLNFVRSLEL